MIPVANPCLLTLNNIVVLLTTQDSVFDLSTQEISKGDSTDRMTRLGRHILEQKHIYPMFPGGASSYVDFSHEESLSLPVSPDMIVMTSQLRHFIKVEWVH